MPSAPDSMSLIDQLNQGGRELGIALDPAVTAKFVRFAELLEEGNRHLNLTRVPPEEVATLHFLDSLLLVAVFKPDSGARLLDVGTGAGFPGMPLALVFPEIDVTLMDSTRKRLGFLDGVLADLGISNARTLHARAEELARDPRHRERYDYVVARAVAPMSTLAGWLLPFVRPGGVAVAYKSRDILAEVDAARTTIGNLGATVEKIQEVPLPGTDIVRNMIVLRKSRSLTGRRR